MSTSIFQVPGAQSEQGFQPGALNLWLAITLPLMLLTFAAWLVVYWWINRREKFKEGGERQEAFIA
jgi:hypothetical protein